jgi:glycine cleavage system transcriptional repressor
VPVLDDVSLFLHERKADILESRVSLLRGQFGLLLLLRADEEAMKKVEQGLSSLDKSAGIRTELRNATATPSRDDTPMRLTASGKDPANAMHRLGHLMRVLNVNIENIETKETDDGGGESSGFSMEMDLCVPRATPLVMLKQYVQSLADESGIKCDVRTL